MTLSTSIALVVSLVGMAACGGTVSLGGPPDQHPDGSNAGSGGSGGTGGSASTGGGLPDGGPVDDGSVINGGGGAGAGGGGAGAGGYSGASGRAGAMGQGGTGGGPLPEAGPPTTNKVDLLFMIDNSSSMADKQEILAQAVGDLVDRLVNPPCIDVATGLVIGLPLVDGSCASGVRDFQPIRDLHIGIISSSLGSHGAKNSVGNEQCPDPDPSKSNAHNKDMSHLLSRSLNNGVEGTVPTFEDKGFLAWNGSGIAAQSITLPFQSMVLGVGQHGCGYEAQLEAVYRFLNDPNPYASINVSGAGPGISQLTGTDSTVLAQRAAFLRPDSLVAIVAVTDENDCSINDADPQGFYALLPPVSFNGTQVSQIQRGTSACDTNPNDACCFNCGLVSPPPFCTPPSQDPACVNGKGTLLRTQDPENLRCFAQKRRYGKDFLYPIARYVEGLTQFKIHDLRQGPDVLVDNPLFSDLGCFDGHDASGNACTPAPPRNPSLVFFAGIIGVPWQDVAVDPNDLTKGYKSARQLNDDNTWRTILGDPENAGAPPVPPDDPHMIESIAPRPGLSTPESSVNADPINGHEWDVSQAGPPNADLQYACTFALPVPRICGPAGPDCDCVDGTMNMGGTVQAMKNPLCQDASGAYGFTQFSAKAYPGTRELEVLKGIGDQAIVASLCTPNLTNPARADYGFRPAIDALVSRCRTHLPSP
jgi:hypothetical protein